MIYNFTFNWYIIIKYFYKIIKNIIDNYYSKYIIEINVEGIQHKNMFAF